MTVKLLITIVARGLAQEVADVLTEHGLSVQYITQGRGTASSEIRHMLGLGTSEKDIVLTLAPQAQLLHALPQLTSRLHLPKAGHGIAFAIPLTSIAQDTLRRATESLPDPQSAKEDAPMFKEPTHDLILAVVDSESSDLAFDAAKEAGCRGGTVLKSRQVSAAQARKVFGITIQPEKEILMILVPLQDKQAILKAICNKVLQSTGEHVTAFALPVTDVMGLTDYDLMNAGK